MSQKPVAQKLQIKENSKFLLINEPQNYRSALGKLPQNTVIASEPSAKPFDVIQLFVTSKKDLQEQLPKMKPLLSKKGLLWVTYPKGTSKAKADVNRDSIREFSSTIGLQTVALVAVDETWSAIRLKIT